jgi:hypothetical protein
LAFAGLFAYHLLSFLIQRDLLTHHPGLAAASLHLSRPQPNWRYRVKVWWIAALIGVGFVNEFTKWVTPRTYWEDYFGPMCQWVAIIGSIMVAMVHSLDLRTFLQFEHTSVSASLGDDSLGRALPSKPLPSSHKFAVVDHRSVSLDEACPSKQQPNVWKPSEGTK